MYTCIYAEIVDTGIAVMLDVLTFTDASHNMVETLAAFWSLTIVRVSLGLLVWTAKRQILGVSRTTSRRSATLIWT